MSNKAKRADLGQGDALRQDVDDIETYSHYNRNAHLSQFPDGKRLLALEQAMNTAQSDDEWIEFCIQWFDVWPLCFANRIKAG